MNLTRLVWKELYERRTAMFTSLLAIVLGVAAFVAIRSVTESSEQKVAGDLAALGANILLLPRDATLQDYYAADSHGQTLPEAHAVQLVLAGLGGVEHVSPKLSVQTPIGDKSYTLTGILPQAEYKAKSAWGGLQLATTDTGCKKACSRKADPTLADFSDTRVLSELGKDEVLLGHEAATSLNKTVGDILDLHGEPMHIVAVLPAAGTVDDARIFAHLHTVQRMAKAGEVVNAIEIMGCCEDAAGDLVPQLRDMFPDAKVVTISQVVATQVSVNRLMGSLSTLFLGMLALLGGASMASALYANVAQRRREIGTLLACGATPGFVARLFLLKAGILGLVGGLAGALLGTGLAMILGPQFAGLTVWPAPGLALAAVGLALVVAVVASYLPARYASQLDPCLCFKEA